MIGLVREVQAEPWNEVSTGKMIVTSAALLLFFVLLVRDRDGFIFLIDHANLAFHEAGHPIFGILGERAGLYGGTLAQLVFPAVAIVVFWLKREVISFALVGVWFFENLLNIAHYMADARAQVLPLVGGGEHDWTNIFSRWGLLHYDTKIASVVSTLGWLGMITMWLWVIWRWHSDRR